MKSLPNYDDIMNEALDIPPIELKTPPRNLETVRGFLKEFRRIAQASLLEFSLTEFEPFWKMLLDAAQAAHPKGGAPQGKWRLRSRVVRRVADAELQERIRLYANRLLGLALAIRNSSGELLEDRSHQAKLVEAAVSFSKALQNCPDILLKSDPSEMKTLENAVKNFTNIK